MKRFFYLLMVLLLIGLASNFAVQAGQVENSRLIEVDEPPKSPSPFCTCPDGIESSYGFCEIKDAISGKMVAKDCGELESPPPIVCHDCPEMVEIPNGRFMMGSSSIEEGGEADERPRHEVSVKRFRLGKYEVTKQQFADFVDATGYSPGKGCYLYSRENQNWQIDPERDWRGPGFKQSNQHPVVCVSGEDAEAYARWLSRKTGQRYRLPTEAEWEYAARAGTDKARFWGDSADAACRYANVADLTRFQQAGSGKSSDYHQCKDGYVYTAPVGSFGANGLGLYDMLGNVEEWTCSAYAESYDGQEKSCTNDANSQRVNRGGSWGNTPAYVRSAFRIRNTPSDRGYSLGFRLAQDD